MNITRKINNKTHKIKWRGLDWVISDLQLEATGGWCLVPAHVQGHACVTLRVSNETLTSTLCPAEPSWKLKANHSTHALVSGIKRGRKIFECCSGTTQGNFFKLQWKTLFYVLGFKGAVKQPIIQKLFLKAAGNEEMREKEWNSAQQDLLCKDFCFSLELWFWEKSWSEMFRLLSALF